MDLSPVVSDYDSRRRRQWPRLFGVVRRKGVGAEDNIGTHAALFRERCSVFVRASRRRSSLDRAATAPLVNVLIMHGATALVVPRLATGMEDKICWGQVLSLPT